MSATIAEKLGVDLVDAPQFDLRQTIRDMMVDQSSANPADIVGALIRRLTPEQKDVALSLALPPYIQDVARGQAQNLRHGASDVGGRVTTPQRIANWYAATLSSRLFNGQEWKFLGECAPEDLQGAAAERYKVAATTKAEADRLLALADFIEENQYENVADLSEVELRKILGDGS